MKKIPTLFQRNYETDRKVRNEVMPGCDWVTEGLGHATRKFDGTCCMIRDGILFKRHELKRGKQAPEGFIPAQKPDEVTGDGPGWLPVGLGADDKWFRDVKIVIDKAGVPHDAKVSGTLHWCYLVGVYWEVIPDGTYELCGPKIQGNPECFDAHGLVAHGCDVLTDCPRDFDRIRVYLGERNIEGVVWWRNLDDPDCDKVKLKKRDFA